MTKKLIGGVILPIITTFSKNGEFDPARMKNIVKFAEKGGIKGFFVCGTYGSGPLMSYEEKKAVVETVMNSVSSSADIIVNVGSSSPVESIKLAKYAESVGAVAIASSAPFYYSYSYNDGNVRDFFLKLINSVKVPVLLYNIPKASGYSVKPKLVKELQKEGLVGIKDSSSDLSIFYSLKYKIGFQDFLYIAGSEIFIIPTVPLGAAGVISGLANAFPSIIIELFNETEQGNYKRAFELLDKVGKLREILHAEQSIPSIHAFLSIVGVDAGYPRNPFTQVDKATIEKMARSLDRVL